NCSSERSAKRTVKTPSFTRASLEQKRPSCGENDGADRRRTGVQRFRSIAPATTVEERKGSGGCLRRFDTGRSPACNPSGLRAIGRCGAASGSALESRVPGGCWREALVANG